jgi:hypothetical protein
MKNILASITDGLNIKDNYDDWLVLVDRLNKLAASGRIRRISPLPNRRFEKSDEWYLDPETGEIYVHGLPNAPMLPVWERFDLVEHTKAPERHPNNLSIIPTGKISRLDAKNLKGLLDFLIQQGLVEAIDPPNTAPSGDRTEKWFRDLQTQTTYRLVQKNDGNDDCWETVILG